MANIGSIIAAYFAGKWLREKKNMSYDEALSYTLAFFGASLIVLALLLGLHELRKILGGV